MCKIISLCIFGRHDGRKHARCEAVPPSDGVTMENYLLELFDHILKFLQNFESEHPFNLALRRCVRSSACAFSAVLVDVVGFFIAQHCHVYICLGCIEMEHLFKLALRRCVRSSACAFSAVMADEITPHVKLYSF